ncbi:MAG: hypothetical protein EPO42_05205 [Gallionellaceae bacterium]|nr:MAG: hypothetical protein EPO42_05205 [Gallionellaceae bacterium]
MTVVVVLVELPLQPAIAEDSRTLIAQTSKLRIDLNFIYSLSDKFMMTASAVRDSGHTSGHCSVKSGLHNHGIRGRIPVP